MNLKNQFLLSLSCSLLALLIALPGQAFAQETPAPTSVESVEVSETISNDSDAQSPSLDPKDKLYWAKMRDIYTFQHKEVEKARRFSVSLYTGVVPSNVFQTTIPIGLRLDYNVVENIAVEFSGAYNISVVNKLSRDLNQSKVGANFLFLDHQKARFDAAVLWSPFYGKMAFLDSALTYFDLYLAVGGGLAITQSFTKFNAPPIVASHPEATIGVGAEFFLGQHANIRLDYRSYLFPGAISATSGDTHASLYSVSEITAGFGWMF